MSDLDELKHKRLEELQQLSHERMAAQLQEKQNMHQQIEALENLARNAMSKEARQRYGTLKLAHPHTAVQLCIFVVRAMESGKLQGIISDEQLRDILVQMDSGTHQKTIIRK
jgi:programmed cell death protein 5